MVSPILCYEDIETLQEVIRAVRRAGARVDTRCGSHVQVLAARFDAKALRNLVKIVSKPERQTERALGITEARHPKRRQLCGAKPAVAAIATVDGDSHRRGRPSRSSDQSRYTRGHATAACCDRTATQGGKRGAGDGSARQSRCGCSRRRSGPDSSGMCDSSGSTRGSGTRSGDRVLVHERLPKQVMNCAAIGDGTHRNDDRNPSPHY